KLVARRARTLLRAQQPQAEAPEPQPVGELSRERLCELGEGLASETRASAIAAPLEAALEASSQLSPETATPARQTRPDAAGAAARAQLAQREAEGAARRAEEERRAAQNAQRIAVCERLEQFQDDDIDGAIADAQQAWAALDEAGVAQDEGLSARF